MEDVLDPMDNERPLQANDIDDALHPKEVRTLEHQQELKPAIERIPGNRLIQCQADGFDVIVMTVHVIRMIMVVMGVNVAIANGMVIRVMMMADLVTMREIMCCRRFLGFCIQPALYVQALGLGIIEAGIE
jgi:hypothetical protein